MSEEEKMTTERKPKPRIGSIGAQRSQYGTIGGGTRPLTDVQAPERRDVETSKPQNVETPERSDVQESKPKRIRQTVYLLTENDRWIRHRIAETREEISDVVNEVIRFYRANAGE